MPETVRNVSRQSKSTFNFFINVIITALLLFTK